MSNLVPQNFGAVSKRFANVAVQDDLSTGVQTSFGIIGYKGKVWSIRYRGEERHLMRDDGDGPRNSIEVVILKASSQIAKVFYKDGFVEGSTAAPDCFSNNGIRPEASSKNRQCDTCALCPMNQWGSRLTAQGKAGKACSDSKRLAVVPNGDLLNETFGGPMLLRVPAASLQDMASFGAKMGQMGYPYYAIVTKVAFDPNEAYPKFTFGAVRPLTDDEADTVMSLRDEHAVNRILSESEFTETPAAEPPSNVNTAFEQNADGTPAGQTAAQPKPQPQPQQAAPQPQPQPQPQQAAPQPEPKPQQAATGFGAAAPAPKVEEPKPEPVTPQGNAGGFGAATSATAQPQPQQAAPQTAQQEPAPQPQQAAAQQTQATPADDSVTSEFEAELDSMLDGLLGS